MRRAPALAVSLLLAGATLGHAANALAYCRTKTCDTEPSYGDVWDEQPDPVLCVRNGQGCFVEGSPLHWSSRCISFSVQRDGSATSGIDSDTAEAIIQQAFDKWAAVDCGGGAGPSFRIQAREAVECAKAEYNRDASNANVFVFRDESWPYENAIDALALTTLTFNVETAEIYDADVELNSAETTFTTTDPPAEVVSDLSSVVTHETGHFLGLSHSEVGSAVMRGTGYPGGSIEMRTLTADDVEGICQIFPAGTEPRGSCEPRHGFASECGSGQEKTGGCSLRRAPAPAKPHAIGLLVLLAGLFARRALGRRRD
jgi:hypothetical protein